MSAVVSSSATSNVRVLQSSLWPYWSLINLASISWIHLGVLTRRRRYFAYAAAYAGPWAILPQLEQNPQLAAGVVAVIYVVGLAHVFSERKALRPRFEQMRGSAETAGVLAPVSESASAATHPAASTPGANPAVAVSATSLAGTWRVQKSGITNAEDWAHARVIPIAPCVEAPDADNEVVPAWKARSLLGTFFNAVFGSRKFYTSITVFEDRFYVSQVSMWMFGAVPLFRRTEVLNVHDRSDVLQLMIASTVDAPLAYDLLYGSVENRRTGNELFRLYVAKDRAASTVTKYVFKVADDVGPAPVSLAEALAAMHWLVPASKQSTVPTASRAQITALHAVTRSKRRRIGAWVFFVLAAYFALAFVLNLLGLTALTDRQSAMNASAILFVVTVALGGWLWPRRAVKADR